MSVDVTAIALAALTGGLSGALVSLVAPSLARRTFYEVLRRLVGEEAWTVLDSVGAKRYLDSTVPLGASRVQYRVRAKRGTRTSPSALPIEVGLGVARRRIAPGLAA